ncbi:MAG: integration host factor subunit beta, partial [Nitrospirae bacterium]
MTRSELIGRISKKLDGYTLKQTQIIVESFFEAIAEALKRGEKIEIRGFGSFRVKKRRPRQGRNPKTGEKVDVPEKRVVHFKPSRELLALLNSGGQKKIP